MRGSMALVALVAAVLAGAAGTARPVGAATQQTATATAGHPLVGAWVVDTEVDNPTNPPSFDTFAADGTLVNIGSDGTSVGAWQATGPRTATFTFAGLTEGGRGGAIFIIRVDIEVAATGESFTATHSFTLAAPDGKVLTSAKGGTARGTRIHAEPMDAAGSPPA